jgi:benzoyl-CoA reductase/2-hydroxyglutaryl-CoA dehydratase subunit BcrC/BadD/HgdB
MMHRGHEHFEILGLVKEKNPQFFMSMMDVPFSDEDFAVDHYEEQLRVHVLEPLHETYGIDISDKAIRAAIRDHNEISRVMTEIGDLRKAENPVITGYEFHVLQLVSQVCPHKRILPYLKQTLSELKRRKPDAQPWFRVRLVVTGSEIDDPAFTKLIEDCGAMVVADRYCYGSLPGREQIEILDGETPPLSAHEPVPALHGAGALRRPPHLHPRPMPGIRRRRRALRADEVLRVLEL